MQRTWDEAEGSPPKIDLEVLRVAGFVEQNKEIVH
jgi:hypothetical protein